MPTVLSTNKTTNQKVSFLFAALHNAAPFQGNDQSVASNMNIAKFGSMVNDTVLNIKIA